MISNKSVTLFVIVAMTLFMLADSGRTVRQTSEEKEQEDAMVMNMATTFGRASRSPILRWPEEYGLEYEDVTFPSKDGVPLEAWFIPAKSNLLVIANHPLWHNRYGMPGHLEPWKSVGGVGGNDIEVNYMADYKNLHDAGYNVLTYDMRNAGLSGDGNGGLGSAGIHEANDVVGALQYVKSRPDTANMTIGLFARCCGCNAAMLAMTRWPEFFKDIKCMVAPQPASLRAFYQATTQLLNISHRMDDLDREVQLITSFKLDQMSPIPWAKNVKVPTFIIQVRNDMLTHPSDVQAIFDNIPVKDKKLFWIENSTRRWDGYNYFTDHPEQMVGWFDKWMK